MRKPMIDLGLAICAIAIASDIVGVLDIGQLVLGFASVMVMLTAALTLTILAEKKDQANG